MSSLSFVGNTTSYLRIPNTDTFDFGTGDFTIEWYQYQTDNNPWPRIFSVGSNGVGSGATIAVSIESGGFYYWTNATANLITTLSSASYKNIWVHFAISRSSGVTRIFMNGSSIGSRSDTTNFNGTYDLIIGNEPNLSSGAAYGGYLTYISWVKGVALYTSNFTVPTTYPSVTNSYVLFLAASLFLGTLGSTVVNNSVSTVQSIPVGFSTVLPPIPCFKRGSKILTSKGYVPIENLNKGDFVKTMNNGYLPICMIGKKSLAHDAVKERIKNQLYVCPRSKYPELFEDLIITGCHSILIEEFEEGEEEKTIEVLGDIFVTDDRYRLPACVDKRAIVYDKPGIYTIYHLALENPDYYMNYGIYANGLLVETCSKRYLKELSKMTLIE